MVTPDSTHYYMEESGIHMEYSNHHVYDNTHKESLIYKTEIAISDKNQK